MAFGACEGNIKAGLVRPPIESRAGTAPTCSEQGATNLLYFMLFTHGSTYNLARRTSFVINTFANIYSSVFESCIRPRLIVLFNMPAS